MTGYAKLDLIVACMVSLQLSFLTGPTLQADALLCL